MKSRTLPHLVAVLAVTALLSACGTGKTPDSAADSAPLLAGKPVSPAASDASSREEAEAAPTPIPSTTDAIWKAIDKENADLQTIIQNGALKEVHHKAYAIRDLVAALPAHASKQPADAQTKLQQDVKFVATLAERLDAAGDSGDKAGAEANYKKLVAVLGGMTRSP